MKKTMSLVLACLLIAAAMLSGCTKKEYKKISGADDLKNTIIGVQEGTTGDIFATDVKGASIQRFKKAVDAAIDLKNGKIDAIILDEQPAKKIVEKNPKLVILNEEFALEDYAIAVKKGDTELLAKINATLNRIKNDGTYQKFIDAYIPESGEATALPERTASTATEELVIGTNAEFSPFEYMDGDKIVGFDIEIAQEIAADMGKKLRIENMNFDSLINALNTGKVDMVIAGMTATDERKQNVDFSDTYYVSKQVIIINKKSLVS